MEERTQRMKAGKVSFRSQLSINSRMNERLEKINEVNVMELSSREKSGQSAERQCPLDYPKSPYHAMEFLSRTWSPSSDDFFKLFTVNNLVPRLEDKNNVKEEHEEHEEGQIQCIQSEELNMGHKKKWPVHEREHQIGKMKLGQPKSWLSGELLKNILKVSPTKRRKEELRLHVSQVNAALSVANLAAAISGILANCSLDPNKHGINMINMINGGHEECDQMKMNSVLASAAALIATVCAEAAESVGAQRAHISSAISSGLQTRTSADMLDLTANAATSLRGVATLERRATSKLYFSDDQKMLSNGSKLLIRTPAGKVELRSVRIYLKHSKLILLLGKKLMGGFITTSKEYRIIDIMEDRGGKGAEFTEDECGMYFVTIATSEGTIKLLFQDEKQFKAWKSSISHLLFSSHGSCKLFS